MKDEKDVLRSYYQEGFNQLGIISLFANQLAVASVFSIFTNLLEIKIKLDSMQYYSRRIVCEGAKGIGKWYDIMELLAIFCIPVNFAIIYFTGTSDYTTVGISSAVEFLNNNGIKDPLNVFMIVVGVEHVLLLFAIFLNYAI